jgi:S1-C subfamily serine protease
MTHPRERGRGGGVKGPKHLWTGDWRATATTSRAAAPLRELPSRRPSPSRHAAGAGSAVRRRDGDRRCCSSPPSRRRRLLNNDKPAPRERAQAAARDADRTIYAKASPAVVSVRTRGATGTGFLFDRDGTLVTNAHVVGRSRQVAVRFGPTATASTPPSSAPTRPRPRRAEDRGRRHAERRPLALADSSRVKVGDTAVAIGNPFGSTAPRRRHRLRSRRHIRAPNGVEIDQVIQTDAPINPATRRPLLDTARARDRRQLADRDRRPDRQRQRRHRLRRPGEHRPRGRPAPEAGPDDRAPVPRRGHRPRLADHGDGAVVRAVRPARPGARAGIQTGDVIVADQRPRVDDPSDVSAGIRARRPATS